MQQLSDQLTGDRMALLDQFLRQFAHTLTRPTQRRFPIPPRHWLHQPFQVLAQTGVLVDRFLAPASFAADTSGTRPGRFLQFLDALPDGTPGDAGRTRDGRDASPA